MSNNHATLQIEDLSCLAQDTVPKPILQVASGGRAGDLDEYFDFLPNCYDFGERLIQISGLVESALYVHMLVDGGASASPTEILLDHLRGVLFGRGYDRGLALSIVERIGWRRPAEFKRLIPEGKPDLSFVASRPKGSGNILRQQRLQPVEHDLVKLLKHLAFLRNLEFIAANDEVLFEGAPLEVRPFLYWNGERLLLFRNLHSGDPASVRYKAFSADTPDIERVIDIVLRTRLRDLSAILGGPPGFLSIPNSLSLEPLSKSIFPLFADTYPAIKNFAEKVFDHTERETRLALWCNPAHHGADDAAKLVDDEAFITNAIIRECMEKDPVYVLERYFQREKTDYEQWLNELVGGRDVKRICDDIERAASAYEGRLAAFYPDSDVSLTSQLELFKARLVAQKIAAVMGFPISEQNCEDEVSDYYRRVAAFDSYLRSDSVGLARVGAGLLEITKSLERILLFLIRFYEAVRVYDPYHAVGLSEHGRRHMQRVQDETKTASLTALLRRFCELGHDGDLRNKLSQYGGREGVWPGAEEPKQLGALSRFIDPRNNQAHKMGSVVRDPETRTPIVDGVPVKELVSHFLAFLEWLENPEGRTSSEWRIYPSMLALHVVTVSRCGITSVRYVLKQLQEDKHQEITLYTQQRLDKNAGFFYALPNLEKVHENLWVNPVLVPTTEFDEEHID